MNFSFIDHVPIPDLKGTNRRVSPHTAPLLAISADGTKFAAGTDDGVVSVWDVRHKLPLKMFEVDVPGREVPLFMPPYGPCLQFLQFSSGIFGREVLVFIAKVTRYFSSKRHTYL